MKEIIVFSDVEMGAGNLTDDFIADKTLARVIRTFGAKKHPVDLVLNGDTFDFLKCPFTLKPRAEYTRYVSADVALAKLRLVYKAHRRVFHALRDFVVREGKSVYFIRGNHDLEIAFPEVQHELQKYIGRNVFFPGLVYDHHGAYIEHGQQYDIANFIHPRRLFTRHRGEKILNNSFSSFTVISALIPLKEHNPFLERIKPWAVLLTLHTPIGKKVNRTIALYFLKSLFYYPLRYYDDPTRTFPRQFVGEFIRRVRQWDWDVTDYLPVFKKKRKLKKVIVLGHIHEKYVEQGREHVIIRPGTWRDEYTVDQFTGEVQPAGKRFVRITVNGGIRWAVVAMRNRRKPIKFVDIVKDEKKYMRMAKEEEGY